MGTEVKSSVGSYDQTHANYAQLVHARRSAVAWPPGASRFAPLDPVREARARKDIAFTPAGSPPPSIALHPRIGATRPMGGASLCRHRRRTAARSWSRGCLRPPSRRSIRS
jgi:hypothetical protein